MTCRVQLAEEGTVRKTTRRSASRESPFPTPSLAFETLRTRTDTDFRNTVFDAVSILHGIDFALHSIEGFLRLSLQADGHPKNT